MEWARLWAAAPGRVGEARKARAVLGRVRLAPSGRSDFRPGRTAVQCASRSVPVPAGPGKRSAVGREMGRGGPSAEYPGIKAPGGPTGSRSRALSFELVLQRGVEPVDIGALLHLARSNSRRTMFSGCPAWPRQCGGCSVPETLLFAERGGANPAKRRRADAARAVWRQRACGELEPAGQFAGRERWWWRGGGSNSRPSHCERDALPAELPPHGNTDSSEKPQRRSATLPGVRATDANAAAPSMPRLGKNNRY